MCLSPALTCREFKGTVDTSYICKWFAPLSKIQIEEPDYNSDVWDKALVGGSGKGHIM